MASACWRPASATGPRAARCCVAMPRTRPRPPPCPRQRCCPPPSGGAPAASSRRPWRWVWRPAAPPAPTPPRWPTCLRAPAATATTATSCANCWPVMTGRFRPRAFTTRCTTRRRATGRLPLAPRRRHRCWALTTPAWPPACWRPSRRCTPAVRRCCWWRPTANTPSRCTPSARFRTPAPSPCCWRRPRGRARSAGCCCRARARCGIRRAT